MQSAGILGVMTVIIEDRGLMGGRTCHTPCVLGFGYAVVTQVVEPSRTDTERHLLVRSIVLVTTYNSA